MNRREALKFVFLIPTSIFFGCERSYERESGTFELGKVEDLLLPHQMIQNRSFLVYLDDGGWSALNTRCTYDGCGLSFRKDHLSCSCCRSVFQMDGRVEKGPAENPLTWHEISFEGGKLFADAGKPVEATYRFTNPGIEKAVARLRELVKEEGTNKPVVIPDVLLGDGGEPNSHMIDEDPNAELERQFLKGRKRRERRRKRRQEYKK